MSEIDDALAQEAAALRARDAETPIKTLENPNGRLDTLSRLDGTLGQTAVTLRYIPDKRVLTKKAFDGYLAGLDTPADLESAAARLLSDLNDELVARWIQIRLQDDAHQVLIEDRQPKWDNPALLGRIEKF